MPARPAMPTDLPRVSALLSASLHDSASLMASALPAPLAVGAAATWLRLLPGLLGLQGRLRVFIEDYRGQLRSTALVYDGHRPEWVVLTLAALSEPGGADSAFRLLSGVSAAAARAGIHRLFAAVPDEARARETFFQAGFYSYTRETWYVAALSALPAPSRALTARRATGRDAHDLFRFYVMTTPHAVQRAEQLTVTDFDVSRRGGAYDPPHLIGGNPLAMRRTAALIDGDELRPRAFALGFAGLERHAHVRKVRTADGDVDLARDLVRETTRGLRPGRPLASPVRSYEEHVGRALLAEGFEEAATAMLFTKELALRVEERAFAPAVVR
ncbi:MAG: hypothetical protein AUI58_08295 [Chloroflexi bacterium 13_1_40CM_2_70_6]|nr:MAG: hypothetical protein AUI58_08295 [Chloroflexi bacterium 13_1_40CM_2_70_6]